MPRDKTNSITKDIKHRNIGWATGGEVNILAERHLKIFRTLI